jgi:hypothetical protein
MTAGVARALSTIAEEAHRAPRTLLYHFRDGERYVTISRVRDHRRLCPRCKLPRHRDEIVPMGGSWCCLHCVEEMRLASIRVRSI